MTIDYLTLTIGENAEGDEIYSLQKDSDMLSVPVHLEALSHERGNYYKNNVEYNCL